MSYNANIHTILIESTENISKPILQDQDNPDEDQQTSDKDITSIENYTPI